MTIQLELVIEIEWERVRCILLCFCIQVSSFAKLAALLSWFQEKARIESMGGEVRSQTYPATWHSQISQRFKTIQTIHEFCQLSWTFHALIEFLDDGQASVQVSHCKISMGQAFVGQQFEGLLYHPMVTSDVTHHICKHIVYPWFSPYIPCKSTVYCRSMSLLLCHPLPILVVTRRAWANGTTVHRNGFASLYDSGRWINIVWFSRICWGRLGEPSYLHQGQGYCADSAMHQRTDNVITSLFFNLHIDHQITVSIKHSERSVL